MILSIALAVSASLADFPPKGTCRVQSKGLFCYAATLHTVLNHYQRLTGEKLTMRGDCGRTAWNGSFDPALILKTFQSVNLITVARGKEPKSYVVTCLRQSGT